MGPVAVLVLRTLTEESNFMHKLCSRITVPPEIVVPKKKALSSHPPFLGPGSGTGAGLLPSHMGFGARRELLQLRSLSVLAGGVELAFQTASLIPGPLLPKQKGPTGCSHFGVLRCWSRCSGEEVTMASAGDLSPDPITCCSPAAAPRQKANPRRQRGGERAKDRSVP